MSVEREKVVATALASIGTKWVHAGRVPEVGLDCTGLLVYSLNSNGAKIPDSFDYSLGDEFVKLVRLLNTEFDKVDIESILPGDILLFRGRDMYNHVGLYVGNSSFVHSYSNPAIMRVVVQRFDPYWFERLKGIFAYKDFVKFEKE